MQAYLDILKGIQDHGLMKENRTGINTISRTGAMFEHDMRAGFPLLTTKKMPFKMIATELVFFIRGYTDKQWLKDRGCSIWNEWCNPLKVRYGTDKETQKKMEAENDLGKIYGFQWRNFNAGDIRKNFNTYFPGIDQLNKVVNTLKENPFDRRMIVTAWNPEQLHEMALPPCHYGFQLLSDGTHVDLLWNQRSVDTPLGLPFNIASYGLLLELIARHVGMIPRKLIGFLADTHYYVNQKEGVEELLKRTPGQLPTLTLPKELDLFTWDVPEKISSILKDYKPQSAVKMPIAI